MLWDRERGMLPGGVRYGKRRDTLYHFGGQHWEDVNEDGEASGLCDCRKASQGETNHTREDLSQNVRTAESDEACSGRQSR